MKMDFAFLTVAEMICFLLVLIKCYHIFRQLKVWVGLGRVQSFMLLLGRVWLGHFTCGSVWVGSSKLDPRPICVLDVNFEA